MQISIRKILIVDKPSIADTGSWDTPKTRPSKTAWRASAPTRMRTRRVECAAGSKWAWSEIRLSNWESILIIINFGIIKAAFKSALNRVDFLVLMKNIGGSFQSFTVDRGLYKSYDVLLKSRKNRLRARFIMLVIIFVSMTMTVTFFLGNIWLRKIEQKRSWTWR